MLNLVIDKVEHLKKSRLSLKKIKTFGNGQPCSVGLVISMLRALLPVRICTGFTQGSKLCRQTRARIHALSLFSPSGFPVGIGAAPLYDTPAGGKAAR